MQRAHIAVCGCGPAGLAAALLLHRAGHRVRVFERFDTPQPVGSGLLWVSAMFTPFYQSDRHVLAFVRDWLAGPISNLPIGRQVLVRLVSGMTVAPLAGARFSPFRPGMPEHG